MHSDKKEQMAETDLELSYWEALRAYWRIYWPCQVAQLFSMYGFALAGLRLDSLTLVAIEAVIGAATLFLVLPRLYGRPYRGFALESAAEIDLPRRGQVWWFLWWRQLVAGVIAGFLAWPANIVLGIMGIQKAQWITVFAGVLIIGPILIKMLVGNPFDGFQIEVRRSVPQPTI
jgi:hypothetical protein